MQQLSKQNGYICNSSAYCFFFFLDKLQCITRKRKNTRDNLSYSIPIRQGADYPY